MVRIVHKFSVKLVPKPHLVDLQIALLKIVREVMEPIAVLITVAIILLVPQTVHKHAIKHLVLEIIAHRLIAI